MGDLLPEFYWHVLYNCTVYEIFDFEQGCDLGFGHWPLKIFCIIWKPIRDLLFYFYSRFLSISYRFWIFFISNFTWFDLDLWRLKVIWGPIMSGHSKIYIWLHFKPLSIEISSLSRIWVRTFQGWPWPLTFRGHLRSNVCSLFESSYICNSYLASIDPYGRKLFFSLRISMLQRLWLSCEAKTILLGIWMRSHYHNDNVYLSTMQWLYVIGWCRQQRISDVKPRGLAWACGGQNTWPRPRGSCPRQPLWSTASSFEDSLGQEEWQSPNHFHLLPDTFGINSQVIFHPFPLFPLSGRDSSTIFLSVFPGNPSPSTGITFCDVSTSTDATQVRHTHRLANTFQLSAYD